MAPVYESGSNRGLHGRPATDDEDHGRISPSWEGAQVVAGQLQVVVVAEAGAATGEALIVLDKAHERLEHLGLTLGEGNQRLREGQRRVLERPVQTFLATPAVCPDCGRERGPKDHKPLGWRTLLGAVTPESPACAGAAVSLVSARPPVR
jgi:hypothetical protein